MVGNESSGGGEEGGFTGRAAIGYDHGYDGEVFYLGLALDPHYVEGFVEGCLERIGEDNPEEELLFRGLWEDETQRDVLIESFKALQCIEDIFNEIGDEKLALIFFPNGLDGDKGDLEEIAKALEEHGITRELWDASLGEANDPAEIQARFDESERRLIEPRKERIWYHARKMNDV